MSMPTISSEPQIVEGWLERTRKTLFDTWVARTRHGLAMPTNGWACEIGYGCQTCSDHLSIPCSLATEAHEIAVFLNKPWNEDEFPLFFRLYLVILSEFVRNLEEVGDLIGVQIGKPPTNVCAWANNFAKHRLCILIQHHPDMVAADAYGPGWTQFETELESAEYEDRCGKRRPIQVIDQRWFSGERKKDTAGANSQRQAVIVIPPLMDFLESTMNYFRSVVDACRSQPERVKKFESEHYLARCR